jgi:hypothetical protein
MGSEEVSRLRERAAFMRRLAVIRTRGDAEVNRDLLRLAASLDDQARALEVAQRNRPRTVGGSGL